MNAFSPMLTIAASAGSGKTFQLSYRWLRILAMGVAPDTIGGFTFSRKAAGEIFDSILQALGEAASGPEGAAVASNRMGLDQSEQKFLQDLRRFIQALPHLNMGTLDAHIARLLSAVSLEIGLPAEVALQDELSSDQVALRREILGSLFGGHALKQAETALLMEMFEQATFGSSGKSFLRPVLEFVEAYRSLFRSHPRQEAWQGPKLMETPRMASAKVLNQLEADLCAHLESMDMHARARASLITFVKQASAYSVGSVWSRDLTTGTTLSDQILEGATAELTYSRKTIDVSGPVWEGLQQLADHVTAVEWEKARQQTMGMWGFLALFEAAYREKAYPRGQLTFDDASTLMSNVHHLSPMELAYRLDGEIDHWLLDEFQDTSLIQWKVLNPFLQEVLQDPEQRRSLFIVGDVKQAIYGWRGGDAALFEQVQQTWPGMETQTMATSYRSAPAVLSAVNDLFSDLKAEGPIPPSVAERWNAAFEPHRAAKETLSGEVSIYAVDREGDLEQELIFQHLRTLPEGCEIAILVQDNTQGNLWADLLRAEGFQVSREGSSPLRGSRILEVVLAALRCAAHPADPGSRTLLNMAGINLDGFTLLQLIHQKGIAAAIRLLTETGSFTERSEYDQNRLELLLAEAMAYDARHPPHVDRFLEHIETLRIKELGSGQGIRIMTIHQSKGLGFDAVILPLKPRSGFSFRQTGLVASTPEATSPWVTALPPKDLCGRIPELAEIRRQNEERDIYETLCVLYVAMTRAKRSLLITLPPAGSSENTFGHWIPSRLGLQDDRTPLAHWGTPEWKETFSRKTAEERPPPPSFALKTGPQPIQRLEPSREDTRPVQLAQEFRLHDQDAKETGTKLHAMMEKLDFVEGSVEDFLQTVEEELPGEIRSHVEGAWRMKELLRPESLTGLWKEQKFETLLPEGWVTGVFDRVVLFEDHAWIQDYKTNRTVNEATIEHYRPQMELYRRVLSDMIGLDQSSIECHLLFTRTGTAAHL